MRSPDAHPAGAAVPTTDFRAGLLSTAARLGVGTSLRYLRKNRSASRLLTRPHDPTRFVQAVAAQRAAHRIEALHAFTFNAVRETRAWHESLSRRGDVRSRR